MVDRIYLSIASYCDTELFSTVRSAIENVSDVDRLYLYIYSQDEDHLHPDIDSLMLLYKVRKYFYKKDNFIYSNGVGYARSIAQSNLTNEYKYYFQVDSHTQFIKNWDIEIIEEYSKIHNFWGKSILTSYPAAYVYDNEKINFVDYAHPPVVRVVHNNDVTRFQAKYREFFQSESRQETGYFCAGLAFGYSEYFLEVPYDPSIFFQGEEHTMSIRFFNKNTRLIAPNKTFIYHNYNGDRRSRNWEKNSCWHMNDEISKNRITKFFNGEVLDTFGVKKEIADLWIEKFCENLEDVPKPARVSL